MLPLKRERKMLGSVVWTKCLPFVENTRAVLIHRPRVVTTYNIHRDAHIAVNYWCRNSSTGGKNFTFLPKPPVGKLLCKHCELNAVAAGLPSTDSLVGEHVHLGIVVAQQTCCQLSPEPQRGRSDG